MNKEEKKNTNFFYSDAEEIEAIQKVNYNIEKYVVYRFRYTLCFDFLPCTIY